MVELNAVKKMLEKDWFVIVPSKYTDIDTFIQLITEISGNKKENIKVIDVPGNRLKHSVVMLRKTPHVMERLNLSKNAFKGLVEVIISSDKKIFSISSKTQSKDDKNYVIKLVLTMLNETIEEKEYIEKENLSMYR